MHQPIMLGAMDPFLIISELGSDSEFQVLRAASTFYFQNVGFLILGLLGLLLYTTGRIAVRQWCQGRTDTERVKQLAMIAEKTTNSAIFTDPQGRIIWVNQGFTRLTGYTLEEVMGKAPGEFLQCEETSPATIDQMRRCVRNRQAFNGVVRNQGKDGQRYWLHIDFQPTFNDKGVHNGFVAIQTDISNQVSIQEELKESKQLLRLAIDSIPSKIAILDENANILFVNMHWKRFYNERNHLGDHSKIGSNYFQFMDCTDRAGNAIANEFANGVRGVIDGSCMSFECEYPCESVSGLNWFLVTLTRFNDGRQCRIVASHLNITDRKHIQQRLSVVNQQLTIDLKERISAEERLQAANDYLDVYRKIIDHHAIVAETDTAGKIVAVNDAFCKISGYSREELIGSNHRIVNSGIHPKEMWVEMYRTVANGGFWHGEICNRRKDGSLYWVDTTIAPLLDDAGKVKRYFAIRADITSLKQARSEAEAANRIKSEFLANMSHEIRTPMTAILGYADILGGQVQSDFCSVSTAECVNTIKRNAEHLLSVINDILDLSKIEADKMTAEIIKVSPLQVVQEVMDLMKVKSHAKSISLEARIVGPIPNLIETDPTRLRQVLVNLVGNAIKFTEVGGVTIQVRMHPSEARKMVFDIIDTGIGLNEEQVTMLFQPFEQVDASMTRKFGGTGLGLRISKRLAEILGGDITVSCSVDCGCTFSASIATGLHDSIGVPEWESKSAEGSRAFAGSETNNDIASPDLSSQSLIGLRILLVEDGLDNQRLISFILGKAGAVVEVLENGRLAVERLTIDGTVSGGLSGRDDFDIILMDMQMPEMDGYSATKLLREKGCQLPILALTAHAMDSDEAKCLAYGCNTRLTKPIDKKTLLHACAFWQGNGQPSRAFAAY